MEEQLRGDYMSIKFIEDKGCFHLKTKNTSYIIGLFKKKYLVHGYWGGRINAPNTDEMVIYEDFNSFSPNPDIEDKTYSLDTLNQEYGFYGKSDYRNPAIEVEYENGSRITELYYESHSIIGKKVGLKALPSAYAVEGDRVSTLRLDLRDPVENLLVSLYYCVYEDYDIITRFVEVKNKGCGKIKLNNVSSLCIDFEENEFEFIQLVGSWVREREIVRQPVGRGTHIIESKRGASSHHKNPFVALARRNTDEFQGQVYGFNLLYSGSFRSLIEVNAYNQMRFTMGLNPFNFSWNLFPGEVFESPEVVMSYSQEGLNGMSRLLHSFYKERLIRGEYKDRERPILMNNWEATYFDFDEEKIISLAKEGADLGIELFVLDDGWFGKRNSDKASLGDWIVNREKLPSGIEGLAHRINSLGMKFGIWVEPEMVSPDSDLYRSHPDWCIHVPNRTKSEGRNQLILDLSRREICNYVLEKLTNLFESANIEYVKWDMNRSMTDVYSIGLSSEDQRQMEHRYYLGLYGILEELTKRFPRILFESCCGGGGRFDPAMLFYMPQTWTSDNTDAISRLSIQYGTSLAYPQAAMGAHVSIIPNHQTGRVTDLKIRGDVAMSANFGYELDLTKLSQGEREEIREQIRWYKANRKLIQYGEFYRLKSPFHGNETAWMIIDRDKTEFIVYYYRVLKTPNMPRRRLRLKYLDSGREYIDTYTKMKYYGDVLMNLGIVIPHFPGDFKSHVIHFKAK